MQSETMVTQTEYDRLVEEKLAFQAAGMVKKVPEWDYKIRKTEALAKYQTITFAKIIEELGIAGLNRAVGG